MSAYFIINAITAGGFAGCVIRKELGWFAGMLFFIFALSMVGLTGSFD
jgi:hypothetical protein